MADWLRPVFARSKSSGQVASTLNSVDKAVNTSEDGNEDDLNMISRSRPTSRVSSFIGLRSSTPPVIAPEHFPYLRNPHNAYQKPNCDHMAEALKVIMMTRSMMVPLPAEYNSHILHLLEAYQDAQEQMVKKQLFIEEVKEAHTKDIREFEKLAEEWESKEKDYKAELKRLEVVLSKTEGGMVTVMMTRTESKIHGSKRFSDSLGRGIGTIKERHATRNRNDQEEGEIRREVGCRAQVASQVSESLPFNQNISALRNCSLLLQTGEISELSLSPGVDYAVLSQSSLQTPENFNQDTDVRSSHSPKHFYSHLLRPQRPIQDQQTPQSTRMASYRALDLSPQQIASSQQGEFQLQPIFKLYETGVDSSTSESSPGFSRDTLSWGNNDVRITSPQEKPLPKIPNNLESPGATVIYPTDGFSTGTTRADSKPTGDGNKQKRFSFQLGDDKDILSPVIGRDSKNRERLDEHIKHIGCESSFKQSPRHRRPKFMSSPVPSSRKIKTCSESSEDQSSLSRGDSSSSTITAVRHNSGRSSMSIHSSARKRTPSLNQKSNSGTGTGSSEAVAAAVWAFAGSNNKNGPRAHLRPETAPRCGSKQRETANGDASTRRSDRNDREKQT